MRLQGPAGVVYGCSSRFRVNSANGQNGRGGGRSCAGSLFHMPGICGEPPGTGQSTCGSARGNNTRAGVGRPVYGYFGDGAKKYRQPACSTQNAQKRRRFCAWRPWEGACCAEPPHNRARPKEPSCRVPHLGNRLGCRWAKKIGDLRATYAGTPAWLQKSVTLNAALRGFV